MYHAYVLWYWSVCKYAHIFAFICVFVFCVCGELRERKEGWRERDREVGGVTEMEKERERKS